MLTSSLEIESGDRAARWATIAVAGRTLSLVAIQVLSIPLEQTNASTANAD